MPQRARCARPVPCVTPAPLHLRLAPARHRRGSQKTRRAAGRRAKALAKEKANVKSFVISCAAQSPGCWQLFYCTGFLVYTATVDVHDSSISYYRYRYQLHVHCTGMLPAYACTYVDHDAFNTHTSTVQTPYTGDRTRCAASTAPNTRGGTHGCRAACGRWLGLVVVVLGRCTRTCIKLAVST